MASLAAEEDTCIVASLLVNEEGKGACILASLPEEEDARIVASLLVNERKIREDECILASFKTSSDENACKMAPLAGVNEEKKIKEDVCKMASLKTSSDENACKMAPLAGGEECGSETVCQEALLERRGD